MRSKAKYVVGLVLFSGFVSCGGAHEPSLERRRPRIAEITVESLASPGETSSLTVEGVFEVIRPELRTAPHARPTLERKVDAPPKPTPEPVSVDPQSGSSRSEVAPPLIVVPPRQAKGEPPSVPFERRELTTPVTVSLTVGSVAIAVGAIAALAGDGTPDQRAFAATSGGVGLAALAAAGVLYALDVGGPKTAVKVTVAAGTVGVRGSF
jgi:hypothetical protein